MAVIERQRKLEVKRSMAAKDDTKRQKSVEVSVFGTSVRMLFNSGAVRNKMSAKLCSDLRL